MTQAWILQLEGVTKQFSRTVPPAVSDVKLTLSQGDLLCLLGPSGCGKTTLLRLIAGFEHPQAGTIDINGQRVAGSGRWLPPEQRGIGMVFQDYALFPHLTVAKNIAFGLQHASKRHKRTIRARVSDAIALVGLQGLENRYPHELSGGQQQRVALARALAPRPALVLLDEPLSNLDVQVRLRLRQELREILKSAGASGILVTHDREEALSIADQVAVMQEGRLEQVGTPEQIYSNPKSRFVAEFVTQANFLPAQRLSGRNEQSPHVWTTEVGCFEFLGEGESGIDEWVRSQHCPTPLPLRQSEAAELMIRQEDLILEPDRDATVIIRDRQFLGHEYRYCLLAPSGHQLHARTPIRTVLPIGTRVNLSVSRGALRLFPPQSFASTTAGALAS